MDLTLIVVTVLVGLFFLVAFYLSKVLKGSGQQDKEVDRKESVDTKKKAKQVC